jgi:hypothetical protein
MQVGVAFCDESVLAESATVPHVKRRHYTPYSLQNNRIRMIAAALQKWRSGSLLASLCPNDLVRHDTALNPTCSAAAQHTHRPFSIGARLYAFTELQRCAL